MKKKNGNKIRDFAIVILVIIVLVLLLHHPAKPAAVIPDTSPAPSEVKTITPITITTKTIKEENFSGTEPVVSGSSSVAIAAGGYIDQTISDFRTEANQDVPDMRAKFGVDSPPASYTIDIKAKYVKGENTESIVLSEYAYTGGANGNSSYKVFTSSRTSEGILSLSDVIKTDTQTAFTEYVKKQLNTWKPEGSTAPVVFPDAVKDLTFASFTNWSIDDKNLIIYFDKYEIGPGVLGAVAFPLPLDKIKGFLNF